MSDGVVRERLLRGLEEVASRLQRLSGQALGEQDTKATLISPVLRALGWDVEDVEQVRHEYRHHSADRPVDYALLLARVPQLFVEAKGRGENLEDRRWAGQVVAYAAVAGVNWVALTDGDEWRLYNAHAPVDVEDKLFRRFRISEDRGAAADVLAYLARENISRGLDVLSGLWEAEQADRAVRTAVEELFNEEPPAWFVNGIARRLNGLTRGQVRSALERLRIHLDAALPALITEGSGREAPPPPGGPSTAGGTEVGIVEQRKAEPTGERRGGRRGSRVTLSDLIRAGLVRPPLMLERRYLGHDVRAEVRADGTITFGGAVYPSPSTAAGKAREEVTGAWPGGGPWPTNGWTFWHFRDDHGRLRPLDDLRRRFHEEEGGRGDAT